MTRQLHGIGGPAHMAEQDVAIRPADRGAHLTFFVIDGARALDDSRISAREPAQAPTSALFIFWTDMALQQKGLRRVLNGIRRSEGLPGKYSEEPAHQLS